MLKNPKHFSYKRTRTFLVLSGLNILMLKSYI